jgi:hypothetical protein
VICSRFPGYRFEDVDGLAPDDVIDLAASCLFLSEVEAQAAKTKGT